jgi:hypothetical protein
MGVCVDIFYIYRNFKLLFYVLYIKNKKYEIFDI